MVNLVLEGRAALVVGGGEVASRKVHDLLAAKARVTAVAPRACEGMVALAEQKRIRAHWRRYQTEDLAEAFVVVAATDDEAINSMVARDAMARNVLVNVVDRPALCTFTVPATVCRGDLTFAVATEGRCPALAGILREEFERQYGPEYGELVTLFGRLRREMMERSWPGYRIREQLAALYRGGVMRWIAAGDKKLLNDFVESHLGSAFR